MTRRNFNVIEIEPFWLQLFEYFFDPTLSSLLNGGHRKRTRSQFLTAAPQTPLPWIVDEPSGVSL
jgi:hypothetical protein